MGTEDVLENRENTSFQDFLLFIISNSLGEVGDYWIFFLPIPQHENSHKRKKLFFSKTTSLIKYAYQPASAFIFILHYMFVLFHHSDALDLNLPIDY